MLRCTYPQRSLTEAQEQKTIRVVVTQGCEVARVGSIKGSGATSVLSCTKGKVRSVARLLGWCLGVESSVELCCTMVLPSSLSELCLPL